MRAEAEALSGPERAAPVDGSLAARLARWADRLSDRVNPLIVKEVRQGLRTRIFWICFTLLLLGCLVVSLIAYAVHREDVYETTGKAAFMAYFGLLGFVSFLVLPYTAYRSLLKERDDETWVLLTLTGLGPRRILRGKLGSSFTQALLYGSAVMPFLLLSYYLNGIDIPTILMVMGLGWAYHAFLTCLAVSMATWAENRVFRALVGFAAAGGLLMATGTGLQTAFFVVEEGQKFLRDRDVQAGVGLAVLGMATSGVLIFEVAVARLSLPTENYTLGPRVALLAQVLGVIGVWASIWDRTGRDQDAVVAMQILICAYLTFAGMFMALEMDGQAARHRAARGFQRIFTPGALRGFRFIVGLIVLTTACSLVMLRSSTVRPHGMTLRSFVPAILAAAAYPILYLSAPLILSRGLRLRALEQPAQVRMLFILLVVLGMGVPPMLGTLVALKANGLWLNAFNPAVGLFNLIDKPGEPRMWLVAEVVGSAAVVALVWAHHLLVQRDREAGRA